MKDRFQCEVRFCIRRGLSGAKPLEEYLQQVAKHRGAQEADRLRMAARDQYRLGNRGNDGHWEHCV